MTSTSPYVVKGRSGYLIVPIVAIPVTTLGAFMYYGDALPDFCVQNAEKVAGLAALFTLVLVVVALFRRSRSVEVRGDALRYRSWLTDHTVRLGAISAVTFETEISGDSDQSTIQHYLSFWSGNDLLLRFDSSLWPRGGLSALVQRVRQSNPAARLDRDVEIYTTQ